MARITKAERGSEMIVLYNPKAARLHRRLPLSLLALGAVLEGHYEYTLVDGNLDPDPLTTILELLGRPGRPRMLGVTVMPGPQLAQAVPHCREVRRRLPDIPIVWGGYFPSDHPEPCLKAGYVDFVIRGNGEQTIVELLEALEGARSLTEVDGLSYRLSSPEADLPEVGTETTQAGQMIPEAAKVLQKAEPSGAVQSRVNGAALRHNRARTITDPEKLPRFPYQRLPVERYLARTYLGRRTLNHHSSYGCPFACNFCSVVVTYKTRWQAESSGRVIETARHLQRTYGIDALEFHDNNFFVSETRTREFAEGILDRGISWWGEARSDTLLKYSDRTWREMRDSGCRMIFTGAESGSDEKLRLMNKGGTQTGQTILEAAKVFQRFGIVPEFSFVLGVPPDPEADIRENIAFIRRIKEINPAAEIILYLYTPVPLPGLYDRAVAEGFRFPETLEEWVEGSWGDFSRRRNPHTPWMRDSARHLLENFETVLNARFPSATDIRLGSFWRSSLRLLAWPRYAMELYRAPLELRTLLSRLSYQRPDEEGFPQVFEHARRP